MKEGQIVCGIVLDVVSDVYSFHYFRIKDEKKYLCLKNQSWIGIIIDSTARTHKKM